MIELAFKEADRAINVLSIVSGFLLPIKKLLAACQTLDAAITHRPDISSQSHRADGVFYEIRVATKKDFHAEAASLRTDMNVLRG